MRNNNVGHQNLVRSSAKKERIEAGNCGENDHRMMTGGFFFSFYYTFLTARTAKHLGETTGSNIRIK